MGHFASLSLLPFSPSLHAKVKVNAHYANYNQAIRNPSHWKSLKIHFVWRCLAFSSESLKRSFAWQIKATALRPILRRLLSLTQPMPSKEIGIPVQAY